MGVGVAVGPTEVGVDVGVGVAVALPPLLVRQKSSALSVPLLFHTHVSTRAVLAGAVALRVVSPFGAALARLSKFQAAS